MRHVCVTSGGTLLKEVQEALELSNELRHSRMKEHDPYPETKGDHAKGKVSGMRTVLAILLLGALLIGSWGTGNAASTQAGVTPTITTVQFSRIGQNMHIEVDGAGFGAAPAAMPLDGYTNYFTLTDISQGGWTAGGPPVTSPCSTPPGPTRVS